MLKDELGKGHKRKQRDPLGNHFLNSSERRDMADPEWHLKELDNVGDILELNSRRLPSLLESA